VAVLKAAAESSSNIATTDDLLADNPAISALNEIVARTEGLIGKNDLPA
jgi:hypothetical protein